MRNKYNYENILSELRLNQSEDYNNFLRTDDQCFEELLTLVNPLIKKTRYNNARSNFSQPKAFLDCIT